MFLYQEDYYKNTWKEALHPTELIIAKHRNGPTGKIDLFFKSDCTKFIGLDEESVRKKENPAAQQGCNIFYCNGMD